MQIRFNNVYATLEPDTNETALINFLKKQLESTAPNVFHNPQHQLYLKTKGRLGWNGKVTVLKTMSFPSGLVPYVVENINSFVKMKPVLIDERYIPSLDVYYKPTVNLRDYQKDAYLKFLYGSSPTLGWWSRGVVKIPTGGGKTELAIAITQAIRRPTLFLVHRKDLALQTAERFKPHWDRIELLAGGEHRIIKDLGGYVEAEDVCPPVIIATIQSIISWLRTGTSSLTNSPVGKLNRYKRLHKIMQGIEVVFFDEAHYIASDIKQGNWFVKIAEMLPNAFFRCGLTATPFMRERYDNMLLAGATGEQIYDIPAKTLIEKGYLTPPRITAYRYIQSKKVATRSWKDQYDIGIVKCSGRNKKIMTLAKQSTRPTLIMTQRVEHCKLLQSIGNNMAMNTAIIDGFTPTDKRKDSIQDLLMGDLDAIICTTVYDEGMDIPELRTIILAGGGKSPIKARQRLGRGVRLAEGKDKVDIIDFIDTHGKYLKRHSDARLRIWRDEGFEIKIQE